MKSRPVVWIFAVHSVLSWVQCGAQFAWEQDRSTTTSTLRPDDRPYIRISLGEVRGRKLTVPKVPWIPDRDRTEVLKQSQGKNEIDPLPWENDVSVFEFLGIPYAMPPTGNLRFKVKINSFLQFLKKFVKYISNKKYEWYSSASTTSDNHA